MLNTRMTMAEAFREVAERYPDREAVVCGESRVTYGQALSQVSTLAFGLYQMGIRKGDVVATSVPPCLEFIYLFFALAEIGAIIAPSNPQIRPQHLAQLLKDSKAKAIVAFDRAKIEKVLRIMREQDETTDLPWLLPIRGGGDSEPSLDRLLSGQGSADFSPPHVVPHDVLALLYTSGTTGKPKGAIHTHRSLIAPVVASLVIREAWIRKPSLKTVGRMAKVVARYGQRVLKAAGKPQTFLSTVGCHSITGLEVILQALLMGDKLILMPSFHPVETLRLIEQERVTILVAVPTALAIMLRVQDLERYDLSSLLICGTGSAPCPEQLAREVRERFGCAMHIGFGATELGGGIAVTSLDDSPDAQVRTVGRPMPGMEVKIVDENRREVPRGQVGELACRGENLMLGYYGAPDKTAEVMDEEGWYYTGDLAVMDEKGYLRIVGRKKDMIIRGGQNVYPEEIEEYLMAHEKIKEVAVVGVPGSTGGENIWAFLILEDEAEMKAEEVMEYCRRGLERYQIPDRVRFVTEFPRASTGKPKKYELRKLAMSRE